MMAYPAEAEEIARLFMQEHPEAAEMVHEIIAQRRKYALTKIQSEVLAFIQHAIKQSGCAPAVRDIAAHLGWASISSTHRVLVALEERGHIRRLRNKARAIELV